MKQRYKKYTNGYMRYLKALHEGHAYYTIQVNGEYTVPVKDAMHYGSWNICKGKF